MLSQLTNIVLLILLICLTDFAILHFLGAVMTQYVPPANADSPQGRSWKKTNYTIFSNILLKNLLIIKH